MVRAPQRAPSMRKLCLCHRRSLHLQRSGLQGGSVLPRSGLDTCSVAGVTGVPVELAAECTRLDDCLSWPGRLMEVSCTTMAALTTEVPAACKHSSRYGRVSVSESSHRERCWRFTSSRYGWLLLEFTGPMAQTLSWDVAVPPSHMSHPPPHMVELAATLQGGYFTGPPRAEMMTMATPDMCPQLAA
jgi:hypothetical protein